MNSKSFAADGVLGMGWQADSVSKAPEIVNNFRTQGQISSSLFAFKLVEPPVVPDNYYAPKARHNAILASSITLVLVCGWILASDFIRRAKAQFAALKPEPDQPVTTSDDSSPPDDSEEIHPRFVRNLRPKA